MAGFWTAVKTLFFPASVALALYLLLTYAVVPLLQKSRQTYRQYSPLGAIADRTLPFRSYVSDALPTHLLSVPRQLWRWPGPADGSRRRSSGEDLVNEEEGEGMVGFEIDEGRRAALDRSRDASGDGAGRLSRELEEGFIDDSDEERGLRSAR